MELKGVSRVGVIAGALFALWAPAASADVIDVHPGPDAIQNAIDSAGNGDTLRIHSGIYHEAIDVDKALTLVGVGDTRPLVNGQCNTHYVIETSHDGVTLDHLKVVGSDEGFGDYPAEVDFTGRATAKAKDLVVRDTCDAEYGININSSQQVKAIDNRGAGFSDSGIYIGDISSTGGGSLIARGNDIHSSNRGIIVEDSVESADIRILDNNVHDNDIPPGEGIPAGFNVDNSDGVLFRGNHASHNGDGSQGYGFHFDANSDNNRLFDNVATDNDTKNLFDEGSGNCGSGNSFPIQAC